MVTSGNFARTWSPGYIDDQVRGKYDGKYLDFRVLGVSCTRKSLTEAYHVALEDVVLDQVYRRRYVEESSRGEGKQGPRKTACRTEWLRQCAIWSLEYQEKEYGSWG